MLQKAQFRFVDFFILDVEGGELSVLETFDWSIPVCVWIVELDGENPDKDAAVRALFKQQGYVESNYDLEGQACK